MSKSKDEPLSARLKHLREQAGLSAYALAKRAGMGYAVYCRIEAGDRRDPRWSSMKAIAEALGVSLDVFR